MSSYGVQTALISSLVCLLKSTKYFIHDLRFNLYPVLIRKVIVNQLKLIMSLAVAEK